MAKRRFFLGLGTAAVALVAFLLVFGFDLFAQKRKPPVESAHAAGEEARPKETDLLPIGQYPMQEDENPHEPGGERFPTYWTPGGGSYHFDSGCYTIARAHTVHESTLSVALAEGKTDPCNICAGG